MQLALILAPSGTKKALKTLVLIGSVFAQRDGGLWDTNRERLGPGGQACRSGLGSSVSPAHSRFKLQILEMRWKGCPEPEKRRVEAPSKAAAASRRHERVRRLLVERDEDSDQLPLTCRDDVSPKD